MKKQEGKNGIVVDENNMVSIFLSADDSKDDASPTDEDRGDDAADDTMKDDAKEDDEMPGDQVKDAESAQDKGKKAVLVLVDPSLSLRNDLTFSQPKLISFPFTLSMR